MFKSFIWKWKCFFGTKYRIEYTDKLKDNEILIYRHKLYIGRGK